MATFRHTEVGGGGGEWVDLVFVWSIVAVLQEDEVAEIMVLVCGCKR